MLLGFCPIGKVLAIHLGWFDEYVSKALPEAHDSYVGKIGNAIGYVVLGSLPLSHQLDMMKSKIIGSTIGKEKYSPRLHTSNEME